MKNAVTSYVAYSPYWGKTSMAVTAETVDAIHDLYDTLSAGWTAKQHATFAWVVMVDLKREIAAYEYSKEHGPEQNSYMYFGRWGYPRYFWRPRSEEWTREETAHFRQQLHADSKRLHAERVAEIDERRKEPGAGRHTQVRYEIEYDYGEAGWTPAEKRKTRFAGPVVDPEHADLMRRWYHSHSDRGNKRVWRPSTLRRNAAGKLIGGRSTRGQFDEWYDHLRQARLKLRRLELEEAEEELRDASPLLCLTAADFDAMLDFEIEMGRWENRSYDDSTGYWDGYHWNSNDDSGWDFEYWLSVRVYEPDMA